jgi:hypothetical protein
MSLNGLADRDPGVAGTGGTSVTTGNTGGKGSFQ